MGKKAIKFSASWCGPCRSYAPVWNKVKEEITDGVEYIEVDIDSDTKGLAAEYQVRSVPTTVIIQENGDTSKHVGLQTSQNLKELILF
jgi:thioredoxin 1